MDIGSWLFMWTVVEFIHDWDWEMWRDGLSESEYGVCGARDRALIIAVTNTVTDHKPIDRDTKHSADCKPDN